MLLLIFIILFFFIYFILFPFKKKTPISSNFIKSVVITKPNIVIDTFYNSSFTFDKSDIDYYLQYSPNNDFLPSYEPKKMSLYEKDKLNQIRHSTQRLDTVIEQNNIEQHNIEQQHINNTAFEEFINRFDGFIPGNDTQNVHDTYVQKDLQYLYNKMDESHDINYNNIKNEILNYSNNKKEISDILSQIEKRNSTLSNFNDDSEFNILIKTWKQSNNSNKKDAFIKALEDTKENGKIVCPTGVVSRILSNLFIEQPENMPKDKNLYNQEILAKASVLRNKDENINIDNCNFKELLIKECKNDYPHLSEKNIEDIINPWINEI